MKKKGQVHTGKECFVEHAVSATITTNIHIKWIGLYKNFMMDNEGRYPLGRHQQPLWNTISIIITIHIKRSSLYKNRT